MNRGIVFNASVALSRRAERRSLREISADLARLGYLNERGQPFSAKSVRAMLGQNPAKAE